MLNVNYSHWNQTRQDLRQQALDAEHPRTRERYFALYEIASGKSAYQVSKEIKRRPNTVVDWVHNYNAKGQEGIIYKRTGGRPFFCLTNSKIV
jgi:transposase